MKKINMFILLGALLTGCSKKTHILNSADVVKQSKSFTDSTGQKKAETIDRSISITTKDIDTNIISTGKSLTGYINYADSTTVHFANDDISIDLRSNKKTGLITAVATPKPKKVNVKIHQKTEVDNNIHIISGEKSSLKTKLEIKTDSTNTQVVDHTDPTVVVSWFKTLSIWLLVLISLACVVIYLVKKFSIVGLITNWIKK